MSTLQALRNINTTSAEDEARDAAAQRAVAERRRSSDSMAESLREAAKKAIDILTKQRDDTIDHIRTEHDLRVKSHQIAIAGEERAKEEALKIAASTSEHIAALTRQMALDIEMTHSIIESETKRFNQLIEAQRHMVEVASNA